MIGHLSDRDLTCFVRHDLPAGRAIEVDDHLSACDECRRRAAAAGDAAARAVELSTDLLALESHLSEEEVQQYVSGALTPVERAQLGRHVSQCPTCARDVEGLQTWIASRTSNRSRVYLAAAAALVIVLLGPVLISRWLSPQQSQATAAVPPGFDALPPDQQAEVRSALAAGYAELPGSLAEMPKASEALMGTGPSASSFGLLAPLSTITVSDRPVFRWNAMSNADEYIVTVADAALNPVAGPVTVAATSWTPPQPLLRDRLYTWQVTARRGSTQITAPAPPAPAAQFRVMDAATADTLERISRESPSSPLILGILHARAGDRDAAETYLRQVPSTDPYADVARRTLERLETRRE